MSFPPYASILQLGSVIDSGIGYQLQLIKSRVYQ
jgi:hypothetical protein